MSKTNLITIVGFGLILTVFPYIVGLKSYWISVMVIVGIYSLVTIGLSLLLGYAGQISLGHGAFYGIGAYTTAIITTLLGWNSWLTIVLAMIVSMTVALLIGFPTLRLSGHYLAMATLAFGEIVSIFFTAEVELTKGPTGISNIPFLYILNYPLKTDLRYYYFVWAIVLIVLILAFNLVHSRVGRALQSIHGGEMAANAMGVNTTYYKVQVFALSAMLASMAGSLYAHYLNFVSPSASELKFSVLLMVMVAVGGMRSVWGAILGALLLTCLKEYLRVFGDYDILIYGIILMLIMMFLPDGLFGALSKIRGWLGSLFTAQTRTNGRIDGSTTS